MAETPPTTRAAKSSPLKIKLNVKPSRAAAAGPAGSKRPARAAAKKAGKKTKRVAMDAELGEHMLLCVFQVDPRSRTH